MRLPSAVTVCHAVTHARNLQAARRNQCLHDLVHLAKDIASLTAWYSSLAALQLLSSLVLYNNIQAALLQPEGACIPGRYSRTYTVYAGSALLLVSHTTPTSFRCPLQGIKCDSKAVLAGPACTVCYDGYDTANIGCVRLGNSELGQGNW